MSGWVFCKFIWHAHLSPLSLLDTVGHTLSSQILRFFCRDWGNPGTHPRNFSLLSHCASPLTPSICSERPFLLIRQQRIGGWTAPPAFSKSSVSAVLLFLTHTSAMCLSLAIRSHSGHGQGLTPTGGEAHSPSLPAVVFQAHSDGKPFRQKTKKGQTHNANHISPGHLLLLYCPFSFGLLVQGNGILSCELLLRYKHAHMCT